MNLSILFFFLFRNLEKIKLLDKLLLEQKS